MLAPWKKSYDKPRQHIKKKRHHFAVECPYSQSYGFSSRDVPMWELDCKEGWAPKTWRFQTVVPEKTFKRTTRWSKESILKEINPEYSLEELMLKLKLQYFGHLMQKVIFSLEEDPDVWKDWGQEEKGEAEDEMVGWYHWLNGYEFEQTLGDSGGQRSLACHSPWNCKESDVT